MKVEKGQLTIDGNRINMRMPLAKVDKERRIVSGFATLDNVDSQDDQVLAEASDKAFTRFRGNIREMHDKIAAGKLVNFRNEEYVGADGKTYKGIFVNAYVSKGAQDTWEKVLDGTLSGFSIGGNITDAENVFSKDAGKPVRIIKDYDLVELSLVDNPANQLANVLSIEKSASGTDKLTGFDSNIIIKNVMVCDDDQVAKDTTEDKAICAICTKSMVNIDWYEDDGDSKRFADIVSKHFGAAETNKGGVEMGKENEEVATATEEVEVETPAETDEAEATADEQPEAAVEEPVATDEPDIEKMIGELRSTVDEGLEKVKTDTSEVLTKFEKNVAEITQQFEEKTAEFADKLEELTKTLGEVKTASSEVGKRLDALEGETAVKKSGDLETPEVKKAATSGPWDGTFVSVETLSKLNG